jgi:hypothetical protein
MIAFKFLRADGTDVFTGVRWPLPQAGRGAWVQSGVDPCRSGDLPLWAGRTLYEIELAGEIVEDAMKVVAPRGRLRPDCAIGSALFERIHLPYHHEGQRTGAFRFGDSRAMALAGCPAAGPQRRHPLHQQEPARPRRRTARPLPSAGPFGSRSSWASSARPSTSST